MKFKWETPFSQSITFNVIEKSAFSDYTSCAYAMK